MSAFARKIGTTIKERRQALGLSQEALSALSGINRTYLGEIERGVVEVSAVNLQKIASGLEMHLSELIRLCEEKND
jgi:transcriptional regulator with XRE-family HTH domain